MRLQIQDHLAKRDFDFDLQGGGVSTHDDFGRVSLAHIPWGFVKGMDGSRNIDLEYI